MIGRAKIPIETVSRTIISQTGTVRCFVVESMKQLLFCNGNRRPGVRLLSKVREDQIESSGYTLCDSICDSC